MIIIQKVTSNDCLEPDRQGQVDTRLTLAPSVIPNSKYVIMVSDWKCLKYFSVFLYCNHQVHRDFLITLYIPYDSEGQLIFIWTAQSDFFVIESRHVFCEVKTLSVNIIYISFRLQWSEFNFSIFSWTPSLVSTAWFLVCGIYWPSVHLVYLPTPFMSLVLLEACQVRVM
jgi:hypothetical protein